MPENIIDDLRQTLHESINAKILQSSDHFFKQGEQAKVYGVRMYDVGKIAKEFYKKVSVLPKAEDIRIVWNIVAIGLSRRSSNSV